MVLGGGGALTSARIARGPMSADKILVMFPDLYMAISISQLEVSPAQWHHSGQLDEKIQASNIYGRLCAILKGWTNVGSRNASMAPGRPPSSQDAFNKVVGC